MKLMKTGIILGTLFMTNHTFAQYDCKSLGLKDCPSPVDAQLPPAHDMLSWTAADRIVGFRNTYRLYDGSVFHPDSKHILALPKSDLYIKENTISYSVNNKKYKLDAYLKNQNVTGLIILKDGKLPWNIMVMATPRPPYGHRAQLVSLWFQL